MPLLWEFPSATTLSWSDICVGEPRNPALSPYGLGETWFAGMVFVPVPALGLTPGKQRSSSSLFLMCGWKENAESWR